MLNSDLELKLIAYLLRPLRWAVASTNISYAVCSVSDDTEAVKRQPLEILPLWVLTLAGHSQPTTILPLAYSDRAQGDPRCCPRGNL